MVFTGAPAHPCVWVDNRLAVGSKPLTGRGLANGTPYLVQVRVGGLGRGGAHGGNHPPGTLKQTKSSPWSGATVNSAGTSLTFVAHTQGRNRAPSMECALGNQNRSPFLARSQLGGRH